MNHIREKLHKSENSETVRLPAVDILVVGGGVNGLAVAREAQVRGWSSALVEADDFGAGTSGASSRLVHGGIRYLENLEFHLVRESLKERERLLYTAPHLVKPFPLLIPFYKHNRRHGMMLRLGMLLYDVLSFDKTTPVHRTFSSAQVKAAYPGLAAGALYGAALYFDAQAANTERLCVEQAIDIVGLGGSVSNHTRVTALKQGKNCVTVFTHDSQSGADYVQTAGVVINAAGPWVDLVLGLESESDQRLIGGTKGSHFTVGSFPGAPATGVHFEAVSDGRAILVLPLPDGNYLIGATDLFFDGDPGLAVMSDEEINYLVEEVNRLIPEAHLKMTDVLHSVSGVRPLPFSPKAKSAAQVSRSHHLVADDRAKNLFSITGGKLTTHRALGEMVMNRIEASTTLPGRHARQSRLSRLFLRPTNTRRLKLPGARTVDWKSFESAYAERSALPPETVQRLLDLYGVRIEIVESLAASHAAWAEPLPGHSDTVGAEVIFAIREEFAQTLIDIASRRLLLSWRDDAGLDSIEAVASLAATELGWDEERTAHEIAEYRLWIRLRRPQAFEGEQVQESRDAITPATQP